jgi:hypothetical protein
MDIYTVAKHPELHTVTSVLKDFNGRRAGILKALTCDVHEFHSKCDPSSMNLCLYGFPDESWEVRPPQQLLPPRIPEPALGINFCRGEILDKEWLSFVAAHSDAWLISVAYFLCAPLHRAQRRRVFQMIFGLPTVLEVVEDAFEVVEDEEATHEAAEGRQEETITAGITGGLSCGFNQAASSNPALPSSSKKSDVDSGDSFCGACGLCSKPNEFWICCDWCDKWFHGKCEKVTRKRSGLIRNYKCRSCKR